MIGKTIVGRSFKGCVNYNLSKVEKGDGEILEARGVRDFDRASMIRDFNYRRMANPHLSKNVWHTALSFQDNLNNNQMLAIAKQWMRGMGLHKTQYVVIRHTDTDHPHVHIIANRIDDQGKTVSDSNNWKRSETLCRELAMKYQLTPVPSERNEAKINRDKLKGRDLLKTDINRVISGVLSKSKSFEEFSAHMAQEGFMCMIKFNPDDSVRGVSFERDGIKIKASDIHKSLSASNLAQVIELNRLRIQNQQQILKHNTGKPDASGRVSLPTVGKMSRSLDTTEDDEKKRKKKNDFEIGM